MERLIKGFKPENYNIELRINKYTEEVQGHVIISGEKVGDSLKLHSKDQKIISVVVNDERKKFQSGNHILEIFDVENGAVKIDIKYSFHLAHDMEGVYLSTYNLDGKEERIVSTQFESHYAREGFPCVDEPEAKATFDLKIIATDPEDTIIGNMPIKSERVLEYTSVDPDENPEGGVNLDTKVKRKIVEFETTPKMSTYLVAFVMGRFNKVSTITTHGVEINTYAVLNQSKSMLKFPSQIAAEVIDFYDDLFDVKYPLPKLDQVAIPDFEAGAMENWGLVTYRESCLLADEKTPKHKRDYVATVIAHELSHQWFGNLVTMKWWEYLWLNESFANMMEYYAIDKLHPDWNIWEEYYTYDCLSALMKDAIPGVQPVQQDIDDPDEIATLFDGSIVYAKGSRLMRMLMRIMGERSFFAGLKSYFKKHKYGNTTGDDLWAALQPHADFDVKEFMDAWITQPGYPMLTDMAQQRFMINGATDDSRWPLPKIMDDMSGHYIINLSAPEFEEKIARFDKLTTEQRLRLLIDRHLLSLTPVVSTGSLMDLLPKFKEETSEAVFDIVANIMGSLKVFATPDTEYHPILQQYIYNIVAPNIKRLGFKPKRGEDQNDTKLRNIVLAFALYADDKKTIDALSELWNDDLMEINHEIRSLAIEAKFKQTDEATFDYLLKMHNEIADPSIKAEIIMAISDAKKPKNVEKLLNLLKKPDIIKPQDHLRLYMCMLANFWTREKAIDWLYENWKYVEDTISDKHTDDYIRAAAKYIRDDEHAERFFNFFDPMVENPVLTRVINVAHVDVAARIRWIQSDQGGIRSRLRAFRDAQKDQK